MGQLMDLVNQIKNQRRQMSIDLRGYVNDDTIKIHTASSSEVVDGVVKKAEWTISFENSLDYQWVLDEIKKRNRKLSRLARVRRIKDGEISGASDVTNIVIDTGSSVRD